MVLVLWWCFFSVQCPVGCVIRVIPGLHVGPFWTLSIVGGREYSKIDSIAGSGSQWNKGQRHRNDPNASVYPFHLILHAHLVQNTSSPTTCDDEVSLNK